MQYWQAKTSKRHPAAHCMCFLCAGPFAYCPIHPHCILWGRHSRHLHLEVKKMGLREKYLVQNQKGSGVGDSSQPSLACPSSQLLRAHRGQPGCFWDRRKFLCLKDRSTLQVRSLDSTVRLLFDPKLCLVHQVTQQTAAVISLMWQTILGMLLSGLFAFCPSN